MGIPWNDAESIKPKYPELREKLRADVAIVGGGLAGVASAYFLAKAGKKVVLLEAVEIGAGATSRTTAFISQVIDTRLVDLKKMFGEETARLVWQSGSESIGEIERIIREEKIDCEFTRCPAYEFANTEKQFTQLKYEYALALQIGFDAELGRENNLGFKNCGYLEIKNQAKFHPLKFLFLLAQKAADAGVVIFEHTKVTEITGEGPVEVKTEKGVVEADDVIIATHRPFGDPKKTWFKKGMYVSYALEASLPAGMLPEAIYWDLDSPYHYFRVDKREGFDRLIFGGADHRAGLPIRQEKSQESLENFLRRILGQEISLKITNRWIGPILEPTDGLALIGRISPHNYVASAFSGNGMTYSIIAAMMFRYMILGKANAWARVYDPARIPTPKQLYIKGKDYIREFFGGAVRNMIQ